MYAVVGCSDCDALWVVERGEGEEAAETAQCPRCGTEHRRERLRPLATAETADEAREARTALLAERRGAGDASLPGFGDDPEAAVSDEEYLAAAGLDPDAVADAGERAGRGAGTGGPDRRTVVVEALRALDAPTADDVAARAAERGVDPEAARETLAALVREGEAVESGGTYRSV